MSKSLFIVSDKMVNAHAGEEYDAILEVESQPTLETYTVWVNRIANQIRFLWHEQIKPSDGSPADPDPKVVVTLDAAGPFLHIVKNWKIVMAPTEKIIIELPNEVVVETSDRETLELMKKLEERKG